MRPLALVAMLALVLSACGEETAASTTTAVPPTTTSTSIASTTTAPSTTMPAAESTTTTQPLPLIEIVSGEVSGPGQIEVALGEMAEFRVMSDVDDELHVHGYDLAFALDAGEPLDISFVADVPGVFEVEVHTGHTHILEITVQG